MWMSFLKLCIVCKLSAHVWLDRMPGYLYSDSLHLDCLILLVSLRPVCFNSSLIVKNEPIGPFEHK